jgi:hypothetical protein
MRKILLRKCDTRIIIGFIRTDHEIFKNKVLIS